MIQRRQDGSVDFDQQWQAYEKGFGSLNGKCSFDFDLTLTNLTCASQPGHGQIISNRITVNYNHCIRGQDLSPKHLIADKLKWIKGKRKSTK